MKSKSIRIIGDSTDLKKILENRISDRMIHKITNDIESEITIYFESGNSPIMDISGNSIIIRPWNKDLKPFNFDNSIELQVRDLLIIDSNGEWGPKDIFEWGDALKSSNKIDFNEYPTRYWTSKNDLITLIETLIEIDIFPNLVSIVCNRKPWKSMDVFTEFEMLWRRIMNSKKNKIDIIDLEVKNIPINIVQVKEMPPNLKQLHELLKPINDVGWAPKTPLRISLMECLEELTR